MDQTTDDLDRTDAETLSYEVFDSYEVSDEALEAAAGTWSGGVGTTCSFLSAPCC